MRGLARGALTQQFVRALFLEGVIMDADIDTSRLKRDVCEMPDDVKAALNKHKVLEAYRGRPAYQQNDYVGWITRAKPAATRQKRLDQMIAELKSGGFYMQHEVERLVSS